MRVIRHKAIAKQGQIPNELHIEALGRLDLCFPELSLELEKALCKASDEHCIRTSEGRSHSPAGVLKEKSNRPTSNMDVTVAVRSVRQSYGGNLNYSKTST